MLLYARVEAFLLLLRHQWLFQECIRRAPVASKEQRTDGETERFRLIGTAEHRRPGIRGPEEQ